MNVTMPNDLIFTQLLCSRLCHDLVGPIGAISNGIELLEREPPSSKYGVGILFSAFIIINFV